MGREQSAGESDLDWLSLSCRFCGAGTARHPGEISEGDMHETTALIKSAFQHEAVEMRILWGRPARKDSPAD